MPGEWAGSVWLQLFLFVSLAVFATPFVPIPKVRYYGCYAVYGYFLFLVAIILAPLAFIRGRQYRNARTLSIFLKHATYFMGMEWEVRGKEIIDDESGAVVVSNHQTTMDVVGIAKVGPNKVTIVTKKEVLYFPIIGQILWMSGCCTFIDRRKPASAIRSINSAAQRVIDEKGKLWFFPEGTRNFNKEDFLPFKKGAFRTAVECQAPIIPVVFSPFHFIDGENKIFGKGKMVVSVLPPIPTKGLTCRDIDSLIEKTYNVMKTEFKRLRENALDKKCH